MSPLYSYVAGAIELGLVGAGTVLLWRQVLSPAARARREPARLPAWDVAVTDFLAFLLLVLGGSFLAAAGAGFAGKALGLRGNSATVLSGAAAQLGMLAGVFVHRVGILHQPVGFRLPPKHVLSSGAATFLLSLPLMIATAHTWEFLLRQLGLPTERQDLIGMFAQLDSPWLLAAMITLAVAIAPLTEELVFRAGIFRYLRTRIHRGLALLVPAVVFALLHVNWETLQGLASVAPLVVLAVLFSLAYERTGEIGTAIVAHAWFNLNTLFVIFSGINL